VSETKDDRQQARLGSHRHPPAPGSVCRDVEDLAAPYALNALEPDEYTRIERHCRVCPPCAGLVAEARQTVAMLSLLARPVAPPLSAKVALFARVAQASESGTSFRPSVGATPPIATTQTIPSSASAVAPVPAGWRPKHNRWLPAASLPGLRARIRPNWHLLATPLATVPLVLALGIVGIWGLTTQSRLNDRVSEVHRLSAQLHELDAEMAALSEGLNAFETAASADNVVTYDMSPQPGFGSSRAYGQVKADPGDDQAVLRVWSLRSDRWRYEVWLETSGGGMVRAGDLPVNNQGSGAAVVQLSEPFSSYKSVRVKAKPRDTTTLNDVTPPDALFAAIDPNLGMAVDTDAVVVQQSR
jgi:hypothetical protein